MTNTSEKIRSVFLVALMVFSVFGGTIAFSGAAAAANDPTNLQFSANSGGSTLNLAQSGQATTDITFDVSDLNDANSGQTVNFVVAAEDGVEFQSLNSVNTGPSVSSSAQVTNDGNITFSLSPSSSGQAATITLDGVVVNAPANTGNFDLTVDVNDTGGSDASTTFADAFVVGSTAGEQTGFLSGRVSDQNNDDVQNATVTAVRDSDGRTFITQTNPQGEYTLEVATGNYNVTVERQGFTTAEALNRNVQANRTTTANLVIRQLINPDGITVEPPTDIAVANGDDTVEFTVTVTTDDRNVSNSPLEGTGVAVSIADAENASAVGFPDGTTATTDANGQVTFTANSTEVQDVVLEFSATDASGVVTNATASFIPEDGEGVIATQVKDKDTAAELENATVYAVSEDRFSENTINANVSAAADDEAYFRVIDNSTGDPVDNADYDIDYYDSSDFVRVDQLNESDAGIGSGFLGEAGSGTSAFNSSGFQFAITPIEAGNYTVQYTLETDNPAASDFNNVSGAQVTADLTADGVSERAELTDANPVGTTNENGQVTLTNLVADGKNGVNYVVIAERADYTRQYQEANVTSYDTTDRYTEILFLLEQREVAPNTVDITQIGVHPPVSETDGEYVEDSIVEFDNQTDAFSQQVPRDGSIDVIEVSSSATNFQGDQVPVDANVTVSLNESFDGQFLGVAPGGTVVSNDAGNATITVATGEDGTARVLLETVQNGSTLNAEKTATLESDSSVTDSSNVTFRGTIVFDSGSISGIVTNEDNEPIVDSVVYVEEFRTSDGELFTVEPTSSLAETTREDVRNTQFVVTDTATGNNVTVTGAELEELSLEDQFTRVSSNVSSYTLLTFPAQEQGQAQYTLPRVPASNPDGVSYPRIAGVELDSGIEGVGDTDSPVRVDFTQEANVVIRGAVPASGSFQVSELSAPSNVGVNETFNVSATITNDDVVEATQTVEFRVSPGTLTQGSVLVSEQVTLGPGENTTVTFDGLAIGNAGEYNHGVFTNDDSETTTITVGESTTAVEQYDTNGEEGIQQQEVLTAIQDFNNGDLNQDGVLEVIDAFNSEA